jgi:hypothetical protein
MSGGLRLQSTPQVHNVEYAGECLWKQNFIIEKLPEARKAVGPYRARHLEAKAAIKELHPDYSNGRLPQPREAAGYQTAAEKHCGLHGTTDWMQLSILSLSSWRWWKTR